MIDGVLDALAQRLRDASHRFRAQRAPDRVSPERQRQSRDFLPPPAKIDDAVQPRLVVGELAFVDDESGLVFAFQNLRDDLIEGDNFYLNPRREQFKRQIGSGEFSRHRDFLTFDFVLRKGPGGNHHGPVTVAHAAPHDISAYFS